MTDYFRVLIFITPKQMDSRLCSRSYTPVPVPKSEPVYDQLFEQDDIPDPPPDYSPTCDTSTDEPSKSKYSDEFVKEYKRLRKIRKALRSRSAQMN